MFAILKEQTLLPAPNPLRIGDNHYGNPLPEVYLAEGYKPVKFTNQPEPQGDGYYAEIWRETEGEILQVWEWVEDPNIPDGEALSILMGGD